MRAFFCVSLMCAFMAACDTTGGAGSGGGGGGDETVETGGGGAATNTVPGDCKTKSPPCNDGVGAAGAGGMGGTGGSGGCVPDCGCHIGTACYAGKSPQRCGANGDPCHPCPPGQGCVAGACVEVAPVCAVDLECDDDDPCTTDTCGAGQCFHFPVVPQACEVDGWCNVGAMACNGKTECCHGCLLLQGDHFACVAKDGCPSPSSCSKDGLCVL